MNGNAMQRLERKGVRDMRRIGNSRKIGLWFILGILSCVLFPLPSHALLDVTTFYCWDDAALKYQNSLVVTTFDGTWIECFGTLSTGDTRIAWDPASVNAACRQGEGPGTRYIAETDYSTFCLDNNPLGAQGIWESGEEGTAHTWRVIPCDRDGDGDYDVNDRTYNAPGDNPAAVRDLAPYGTDTTIRLATYTDPGPCVRSTGAVTPDVAADGFTDTWLDCQDVVNIAGCGGNCQERITTHLIVNWDADCDSTMEDIPPGGLCIYWEWHKPGTAIDTEQFPFWGGNIQAYLSAEGGGEKTVNFSPTEGTPVIASSFRAEAGADGAMVSWETSSEVRTVGFNLYRAVGSSWVQVNELPILAIPPAPDGGTYTVRDPGALPGGTYTWVIGEVEMTGRVRVEGPFTVTVAPAGDRAGTKVSARAAGRTVHATEPRRKDQPRRAGGNAMTTAGSRVRVGIVEDGLYLLGADEIASALGMTQLEAKNLIARRALSLESRGLPVAYEAAPRNEGIVFYAVKADGRYTDENVYWVQRGPGLRMGTYGGGSPASAPGGVFTATRHEEEDNWPLTAIFSDPAADFWLWDFVFAGFPGYDTKDFTLKATGAADAGPAELTVVLKGAYDNIDVIGPDHWVRVAVNGTVVGETTWNGTEEVSLSLPLAEGLIADGDNTVTITSLLLPGIPFSYEYLDSLDLAYPRRYEAVEGSLVLTGDGNRVVTVGGFAAPDIAVYDVTNPAGPLRVKGLTVDRGPDGLSRVSFRPASPTAVYLAVAGSRAPASVRQFVSANLADAANAAEYLVVAPETLAGPAADLAAYRRAGGMSVKVAGLQEIYDEFNHGLAEPVAIREFLTRAWSSWKVPPRYVLLAGKGTIDFKDSKGIGDNLLPVWIAATPHGLFAADNRFADVAGDDGVPEFPIGRLPAVTAAELATMVRKIKGYEAAGGSWRSHLVMAADVQDPLAGDFDDDSTAVAGLVPADYAVTSIHLSPGSVVTDRPKLLALINLGAYLFNYIGHGGISYLSNDQLLKAGDIESLANGDRLPLTAMMTCLAGRHEMYGVTSLGEALLLDADGGSAAVWSASGFSENGEAVILDKGLFRAVFSGGVDTFGDAVRDALGNFRADGGTMEYILDIYNLLGDPALKLR